MLKAIKKIQEWGNSFGVRFSRNEIEAEHLTSNDAIEVFIRKKANPAKELFGSLKGKIKEPTDKIMADVDRAFKSRFN